MRQKCLLPNNTSTYRKRLYKRYSHIETLRSNTRAMTQSCHHSAVRSVHAIWHQSESNRFHQLKSCSTFIGLHLHSRKNIEILPKLNHAFGVMSPIREQLTKCVVVIIILTQYQWAAFGWRWFHHSIWPVKEKSASNNEPKTYDKLRLATEVFFLHKAPEQRHPLDIPLLYRFILIHSKVLSRSDTFYLTQAKQFQQ